MAALTLSRVSKRYGDVLAVKSLTLDVADGELVVVVGPSGCGKSTVLRLIAGLETLTDGDIHLGDRWLNLLPPKDRDVAMVFQTYALYPHMSVRDNLSFGLRMRGVSKPETQRRVVETAQVLEIGDLLERKPSQLSGGQRQRVALGRAMVREPQAFLMDEPLSNLDAQLRVQMRAELIRLQRRLGTTTVYVTHDQVEAMTMGHRIAVLRDGILQQADTPQHVYERPVNAFVAGFIGSPSMNFLDGELVADEHGRLWAHSGGLRLPLPVEVEARARSRAGKRVTLGIRPEDIGDPRQMVGIETARFQACAMLVEPFGAGSYVHLQVDGPEFVGCFDARYTPSGGAPVEVAVATGRVHLFDPESGLALGEAAR